MSTKNLTTPRSLIADLGSLFSVLLGIAAVAAGLYVGLWLCLIGGIVQFVEAVKITPVDAMGIACGILRFMLTSLSMFLTWIIGVGGATTLYGYFDKLRYEHRQTYLNRRLNAGMY